MLHIHDMQLSAEADRKPNAATGLLAGYTDVDSYYRWVIGWSTHHLVLHGRLDPAEVLLGAAARTMPMPIPIPRTAKMTAISSAITINMAQVFIEHPNAQVAVTAPMPMHHVTEASAGR